MNETDEMAAMIAPTPEQMRALADDLERGNGRYRSELVADSIAALRAAADQLEAVRQWRDKFNSHPVSFADLDAILTANTAPQGLGCDVCGNPHVHVSTPGGMRFCDNHRGAR